MDDASIEAELIRRIGAGERSAFDELYARYSRPLFSYAFKFLKDRMIAEEVLQDAFVKIWRTAARYNPKLSRPFSWAVLVTKRLCIDRLRRMKPESVVEDPMALQSAEDKRSQQLSGGNRSGGRGDWSTTVDDRQAASGPKGQFIPGYQQWAHSTGNFGYVRHAPRHGENFDAARDATSPPVNVTLL